MYKQIYAVLKSERKIGLGRLKYLKELFQNFDLFGVNKIR